MNAPPLTSRRHFGSVADAAARVGVSTTTVPRWIASGQLAGYRVGPRLLRLDPDELDAMLTLIPAAAGRPSGRDPRRSTQRNPEALVARRPDRAELLR